MITIQEHTYSCQYGTLIGNCDKQRKELNLRERTHSLWGYLVTHNDEFVNPLYDRNSQSQIIRPNLSPQNIKFWRGLYCRFETGAHPREPVIDLLTITQVGQKYSSSKKSHRDVSTGKFLVLKQISFISAVTNNSNQKFNIPISIDISIKTHLSVCIN